MLNVELELRLRAQKGLVGSKLISGAEGDRTPDPRLAKPVLSQLSYRPDG